MNMITKKKIPKRYKVVFDRDNRVYDLYLWYHDEFRYSGSYRTCKDAKVAVYHIFAWYDCTYEQDWDSFIHCIVAF